MSSGHLKHPEELEPGDITRTTISAGWLRKYGDNFSAVTIGYGRNSKGTGSQNSLFAEGTRHFGANSIYGRLEVHQAETAVLAKGTVQNAGQLNTVLAVTFGGVRDVLHWRGFEGGIGGGLTVYGVPDALKTTHGDHPVSFQVFFRLRPPAGSMGRMWNMRMSQPMKPMSGMSNMPHQMD